MNKQERKTKFTRIIALAIVALMVLGGMTGFLMAIFAMM